MAWKISDKDNLTQGNIVGHEEVVVDDTVNKTYYALTVGAIDSFADVNVETLKKSKVLKTTDKTIQIYDPNGSNRVIVLPAENFSTNMTFTILNISDGEDEKITIRTDGGTELITLKSGDAGKVYCNGTNWYGVTLLSRSGIENLEFENNLTNNNTYTGITTKGIAGETLEFGHTLYSKSVSGKGLRWYKYSAHQNFADKNKIVRSMSTENVSAESTFVMLLNGTIRHDDWGFTQYEDEGKLIFASPVLNNAGEITTETPSASGSIIQVMGDMYEVNILHFDPSRTWIENG